jgi:hypothetical protein
MGRTGCGPPVKQSESRKRFLQGLAAVFATWGIYQVLLWPRMLFRTPQGVFAGCPSVWADWGAHFAYGSVFAYRPVQDWFIGHPLFHDRPFSYPFLADAIAGCLMRLGVDIVGAYVWPSLLTGLALLALLYSFYYLLSGGARVAATAVTLFLASGGLGFYFFVRDALRGDLWSVLTFPPREYTATASVGSRWNTWTLLLLPQRALLLAMPIFLLLFLILWLWHRRSFRGVSGLKLVALGGCFGLSLIVHVHAAIFAALVLLSFAATDGQRLRQYLTIAAGSMIPAGVTYLSFYRGVGRGFLRWSPGWMTGPGQPGFSSYFMMSWGWFLPLAVYAVARYRLWKNPFMVAAGAAFVLVNLVAFQPYKWDNSKVMVWTYLVLCWPAARLLVELWDSRAAILNALAAACFVLLVFSGLIDALRLLRTDRLAVQLWGFTELQAAQDFRAFSNPTDRVLTSDAPTHWVSTLTGRPILLGYRGWMWTYGIDYRQTEADVMSMLRGDARAETLLRQYQVAYAVIGPTEIEGFAAREAFFVERFPLVMRRGPYSVYRTKQ